MRRARLIVVSPCVEVLEDTGARFTATLRPHPTRRTSVANLRTTLRAARFVVFPRIVLRCVRSSENPERPTPPGASLEQSDPSHPESVSPSDSGRPDRGRMCDDCRWAGAGARAWRCAHAQVRVEVEWP